MSCPVSIALVGFGLCLLLGVSGLLAITRVASAPQHISRVKKPRG